MPAAAIICRERRSRLWAPEHRIEDKGIYRCFVWVVLFLLLLSTRRFLHGKRGIGFWQLGLSDLGSTIEKFKASSFSMENPAHSNHNPSVGCLHKSLCRLPRPLESKPGLLELCTRELPYGLVQESSLLVAAKGFTWRLMGLRKKF